MSIIKDFTVDKLNVKVLNSRSEMGKMAGEAAGIKFKELLNKKEEINVIFAAAPSQNEMLAALLETNGINWSGINAFHMDEYIGLPKEAPQGFGNFLKNRIFSMVNFKSVHYINGQAQDLQEECIRYTGLLQKYPADVVCMGIGENGHIAFNDPWVADFDDKEIVKVVALDEMCRQQQVNDGCFGRIDDVPKQAITLTIPALMKASYVFCVVPAKTKAKAVKNAVHGEISEICPASVLRLHDNAVLFCDADSACDILFKKS